MLASTGSSAEATTHPEAAEFYLATLEWLLDRKLLTRDVKLLVVCGGDLDRDVLHQLGFRTVTITNLDTDAKSGKYAPFACATNDVEALTYQDGEFDFCIAHNGLHHCVSPHRGLLEMFRVARTGIIVFEPRDSLLARAGVRLKFGQDYETAAVAANGGVAGGVRNTAIPNYVYRWTEREIEKTISSFCPSGQSRFVYRYALRIPWGRLQMMNNRAFLWLVRALQPGLRLCFRCLPKQANGFAFIVLKPQLPGDLQPWLELRDGEVHPNQQWLAAHYDPSQIGSGEADNRLIDAAGEHPQRSGLASFPRGVLRALTRPVSRLNVVMVQPECRHFLERVSRFAVED
jgi:SAM-dependent methyltransferase